MWPERWADSSLARGLGHLLFSTACVICGTEEGPFCPACRGEMTDCGPQCPRCALSAGPWADLTRGCSECRGRSQGFDEAVALGPYQGPIRDLGLRLKHVRNAWLSRWAAGMMMDVHGERLRSLSADLVVPVPLHWRRYLRRGYNQSRAIADPLSRRLQLPVRDLLRRSTSTQKLAGRGRAERKLLMRNAFRAVQGAELRGKTVILVDDILTTGATCGACARALKDAGAKKVIAVVLGRAEGWA